MNSSAWLPTTRTQREEVAAFSAVDVAQDTMKQASCPDGHCVVKPALLHWVAEVFPQWKWAQFAAQFEAPEGWRCTSEETTCSLANKTDMCSHWPRILRECVVKKWFSTIRGHYAQGDSGTLVSRIAKRPYDRACVRSCPVHIYRLVASISRWRCRVICEKVRAASCEMCDETSVTASSNRTSRSMLEQWRCHVMGEKVFGLAEAVGEAAAVEAQQNTLCDSLFTWRSSLCTDELKWSSASLASHHWDKRHLQGCWNTLVLAFSTHGGACRPSSRRHQSVGKGGATDCTAVEAVHKEAFYDEEADVEVCRSIFTSLWGTDEEARFCAGMPVFLAPTCESSGVNPPEVLEELETATTVHTAEWQAPMCGEEGPKSSEWLQEWRCQAAWDEAICQDAWARALQEETALREGTHLIGDGVIIV